MKLSLDFLTVPRFFKFLTTLLLLSILIFGFILLMKYRQKFRPFEKMVNNSITEIKISLFPTPTLFVNKNKNPGQWQTYSEDNSPFTFDYPGTWTAQTINSQLNLNNDKGKVMVSFAAFDPSLVGITYCGAYANDPRCEGNIDWGNGSQATAVFSESSKGITMTLHEVNAGTKDIFRRIVKSFRFLNAQSMNILNEKIGSEEKISGTVLKNIKEEKNNRTIEYLIIDTDKNEELRILYNDAGKFDACTNSDSNTARTLKTGQKIELFGIFSAENEVSTCNSSDYYIHIIK